MCQIIRKSRRSSCEHLGAHGCSNADGGGGQADTLYDIQGEVAECGGQGDAAYREGCPMGCSMNSIWLHRYRDSYHRHRRLQTDQATSAEASFTAIADHTRADGGDVETGFNRAGGERLNVQRRVCEKGRIPMVLHRIAQSQRDQPESIVNLPRIDSCLEAMAGWRSQSLVFGPNIIK